MHRACKRKREDGSSPSRATCALWNRAASITARRCISHVGQTPLHAGNEIAYIRVHIYIYAGHRSFTHSYCTSVCAHRGRGEGWTDDSRPCFARPIRAYRRIIYSNGASLAAPTATRPDRPTDFRHHRPYVHLCFLLFFFLVLRFFFFFFP